MNKLNLLKTSVALFATTLSSQAALTAHFTFDGDASDSQGGAAGTEVGSVTYVAGKFGQAASIASVGEHIDLNSTTLGAVGTGDFSVSLWVNLNGATVTSDPALFSSKPWGGTGHLSNNGFVYAVKAGGELDIHTVGGGTRRDWDNAAGGGGGAPSLAAGWNNLIMVRDGTNLSFYLNGTQFGSAYTLTAGEDFSSNFQNFLVGDSTHTINGAYNGGPNWTGDVLFDDLAFYDNALTSAEITALQSNAAPEPSSTALLGLGGLALILRRRK